MRLADGTLWPMPITLYVTEQQATSRKICDRVALKSEFDTDILAVITIESIYKVDKNLEAEKVFGSPDDILHPAIRYLLVDTKDRTYQIGGSIEGIQLPVHFDFVSLRKTPEELRAQLERQHCLRVVGFQTRNPMHRSHRELTLKAAREAKATILIHPVVGMTKPGDVDHYTRVRCYKEILKTYPNDMAILSLNPLAMRMAGPKEAVWHAIIRKNFGCTHFIVGRDHAGPGNNRDGKPFYDPYGAQQLLTQHAAEIGIGVLCYQELVFVEDLGEYRAIDDIPKGARVLNISGTELRRRLFNGIDIPPWFSFPSVVSILRQSYPPRNKQGFTLFFTGLSGSGKTTVANAVRVALLEEGSRTVTLLDSNQMRRDLSTELGFSKQDRELNIKRLSFVASEITKAGGIAVVVAIAPFAETRDYARKLIAGNGGYVEIYVNTPVEECERRDPNGLYKQARAGEIENFVGVNAEYEAPTHPDITLDCSQIGVVQAVHEITLWLEQNSYIGVGNINV
jgi:sulfate adenylyltransferase